MHKVVSRETSNRKYLSKTILACRERQAKKTKQNKMADKTNQTLSYTIYQKKIALMKASGSQILC